MNTQTAHGEPSAGKQFAKYVSQNILGMLGMSAYILVDTFFTGRRKKRKRMITFLMRYFSPLFSAVFSSWLEFLHRQSCWNF